MNTSWILCRFVFLAAITSAASAAFAQEVCDVRELMPDDAEPNKRFGASVSIHGNTAFVGAHSDDENGMSAGAIYVFEQQNGQWEQVQKLFPSDGFPVRRFGEVLDYDGRTLVANLRRMHPDGEYRTAVGFYRAVNGIWAEVSEHTFESPGTFSRAVAVHGSLAVSGSPREDSFQGAVYVFQESGSRWRLSDRLTASDGEAGDRFGIRVDLEESFLVAGAQGWDAADTQDETGALYVFDINDGTFVEAARLTSARSMPFSRFGTWLASDPDTIIAAAPRIGFVSGKFVSVFRFVKSVWTETAIIDDPAPSSTVVFGGHVAIDDSLLVVGAPVSLVVPATQTASGTSGGRTHVYRFIDDEWRLDVSYYDPLMPDDALFGSQQVSIDGRRVLLGRSYANTHGNFSGDAVVFTVAQNGTCCPGDCDGSGTVDFNDLGAMLLEFGDSTAVCDTDQNGTIDFGDLVAALFLFGPCS